MQERPSSRNFACVYSDPEDPGTGESQMESAANSILVGVIIAAASAWITVRLSLKRFRSERWWDRKVEAYERVIEALHHSKAFSDAHLNASHEGRELSEERDKDLRKRSAQAHIEIEKATDMGAFLLSDEAHERLKKYRKDTTEASDTPHWEVYLQGDLVATESCLADLIKIAKKDLRAV